MSGREFWINTSYDGRTKRKESNAIGRVYTQQHGYDSFKVIDYASYERLQSALKNLKPLIIEKLKEYNEDMNASHWHSSNFGVPEEYFDDVADEVIKALTPEERGG